MRAASLTRFAARAAACVLWSATALVLSSTISVVNAQEPAPPTQPAQPAATPAALAPPAAPVTERGTVSGRVLDRDNGHPLPDVNVIIVGTRLGAQTDLDGRFRIIVSPTGVHSVRVMRIGYAMSQVDSVLVTAGTNTAVNFSLSAASVQLQAVQVEGRSVRANSEDALLALQKSAPRVSDGITAEAISRAPGSNAADAITRVTGVSLLDKKFVVVRGLSERYSNTLLNGVELTSPEPLKKIVPLDLFPASLIESIVTSKTATPDRPGDFAGGSVEITTKEFPNDRVVEGSLTFGYASEATFQRISQPIHTGFGDYLAFDADRLRQMPPNPPPAGSPDAERFAEALRNIWTPPPRRAIPDLGMGLNLGGRFGGETAPFGYAIALTYGRQTEHTPNRLNQLIFDKETGIADRGYIANETTSSVDLGAIVNLAARLGQSSKIGLKNLYTRNAEELLALNTGFETYATGGERRIYQSRYVTRQLLQTQLTGDHLIGPLFDSRLEWKGTISAADRDEPENRSLLYFMSLETGEFGQASTRAGPYWFRFLDDRLSSAQLDWTIPISLRRTADASLKVGGLIRKRDRAFDAYLYTMEIERDASQETLQLPPEQAMAPENIGTAFRFTPLGAFALPYESDDDLSAAYVMIDVPVFTSLRLVGGVRMEDWRLNLFQGTRESPVNEPSRRQNRDYLWSSNLTWGVTDRQNIRLAAYRTVARPDPREVSPDYYVAVTGDCANQGNPELQRTLILNSDLRWEYFPKSGELLSVSVFYKQFKNPIVELLSLPGSSSCVFVYWNATRARNSGVELEARRALTFLPGFMSRLSAGLNLTLVSSEADYSPKDSVVIRLPLQGQSNYVANLNLLYANESGLEATLLVNALGKRVVRYGAITIINNEPVEIPHLVEKGRVTLDAKFRKRLGGGTSLSLSGRNLTDSEVVFVQDSKVGPVRAAYQRPGTTISLGLGYAFR